MVIFLTINYKKLNFKKNYTLYLTKSIGVTLLLLIPINIIIHSINTDITAVLPFKGGAILVILSVILTLIGGLIPSKAAAKKDPVLALISE